MSVVSIVPCRDYAPETVRPALEAALRPLGGLDWVQPGMTVVIKANLVSMMKPESAATTHPALLSALCELLVARGARVIVGDSPGGLYTSAYVNAVYAATGVRAVLETGAQLNQNFAHVHAENPDGAVLKSLDYTAYLDEADAIIDFCKLKTHGMMGMSACVKNLFGVIPGTFKPEYHYRFPAHADFADMLVDLNERFRPRLCLVDAVVGMEGNSPTMGLRAPSARCSPLTRPTPPTAYAPASSGSTRSRRKRFSAPPRAVWRTKFSCSATLPRSLCPTTTSCARARISPSPASCPACGVRFSGRSPPPRCAAAPSSTGAPASAARNAKTSAPQRRSRCETAAPSSTAPAAFAASAVRSSAPRARCA